MKLINWSSQYQELHNLFELNAADNSSETSYAKARHLYFGRCQQRGDIQRRRSLVLHIAPLLRGDAVSSEQCSVLRFFFQLFFQLFFIIVSDFRHNGIKQKNAFCKLLQLEPTDTVQNCKHTAIILLHSLCFLLVVCVCVKVQSKGLGTTESATEGAILGARGRFFLGC